MPRIARSRGGRTFGLAAGLVAVSQAPLHGQGTTPNQFLNRGNVTFVVATAGDDTADRGVSAQVRFIRDLLFANAPMVVDTDIDVSRGAEAWPPNPIVYGGPHINAALAALVGALPLEMERGILTLGGETFTGDEYALITVIPARKPDADGPGYPEFLLYAGTGYPGVAEINSVTHGAEPILIIDTFGRLLTGNWDLAGGRAKAEFRRPRARRIQWREVTRTAGSASITVCFPLRIPEDDEDVAVVNACTRGIRKAVERLEVARPVPVTVYVYPDRRSKQALTGKGADGHAAIAGRALHVIRFDSAPGGGMERLIVHEGTHVLAYAGWGPPGSPLLGEGLAVWASGGYGGTSLEGWKPRIPRDRGTVEELLGKAFRDLPEHVSYPLAGLFVEAAMSEVGLAGVRDHLFGATMITWTAACRRAGTSPGELEAALRRVAD